MSHFAKIRFVPFAVLEHFDQLAALVKRALSQVGFWGVWTTTLVALAIAAECSTLAAAPKGPLPNYATAQGADGSQNGAQIQRSILSFTPTDPTADAHAATRADAQAGE